MAEAPPTFCLVVRRRMLVPTQRRPSKSCWTPRPPPMSVGDWMYSAKDVADMLVPVRVTVSPESEAVPIAARLAPLPVEFTQPRWKPIGTLLLHGQSGPPLSG